MLDPVDEVPSLGHLCMGALKANRGSISDFERLGVPPQVTQFFAPVFRLRRIGLERTTAHLPFSMDPAQSANASAQRIANCPAIWIVCAATDACFLRTGHGRVSLHLCVQSSRLASGSSHSPMRMQAVTSSRSHDFGLASGSGRAADGRARTCSTLDILSARCEAPKITWQWHTLPNFASRRLLNTSGAQNFASWLIYRSR